MFKRLLWLSSVFIFPLIFCTTTFAAPQFSSLSVVSNNANTTLAKAGDILTFTLTLAPADDVNGVGQVDFNIGGSAVSSNLFPAGGSSLTHTVTYTVLAGQDGIVSVTGISFQNSLNENIINLPGFPYTPTPNNVTVDNTNPSISSSVVTTSGNGNFVKASETVTYTINFSENVTVTGINTSSSAVNIAAPVTTELDVVNASSDTLVFTAQAGDNGAISPTVDFNIQDAVGNTTTINSLGIITGTQAVADTTAPVFSSISAVSNNADTTIATAGDIITFTLNLNAADTWSATNRINFNIGGNPFQTGFFTSDTTPSLSKQVTFVVPAGEDGDISVTGVTFTDFVDQSMTGFAGPLAPAPNVNVDSITPTIAEVTAVTNPTNDNTPAYTFSSTEVGTITYAGDCSSITAASVIGNNTVDFNALADGAHSNCTIRVTDDHLNQSTILNVTSFTVDTLAPTLTGASVSTSGNANFAKAGETVSYSVTFSENVTASINTASSATNITTLTSDFDVAGSNNDTLIFTAVNGDNGAVTPTVNFNIQDLAGNITTINSLGAIAGTQAVTDTTAPTLNPVTIASNNANPLYAKTNDTVTVSFTSSETITNGSGTLFTEPATLSNISGNNWTLALLTSGNETEGLTPFTLDFEDLAGNTAVQVTAVTDASSVTFDKTNPVLDGATPVAIISNNAYVLDAPTYYAKSGESITLSFTTAEPIQTPTGTILGTVPVFNNPNGNSWTATITGDNTDPEGTVTIDLHILDLAGNNTLNIIATSNGTSVIYDRTAPDNPTVVQDLEGDATSNYKHYISGNTFNWSGHQDLDAGDSFNGSGIRQFLVRLQNTNNGINENSTITMPITEFSPSSMIADQQAYRFYINVEDKAGNQSGEQLEYIQLYGVKVSGKITSNAGDNLSNTNIQVISEYGKFCDTGQEVCSTRTDGNGDYMIILKPEQDYKLNIINAPNYYMSKNDITIAKLDMVKNYILQLITNLESQTFNQVVSIITNKIFTPITGNIQTATEILVNTLSGEITATQNGTDIMITSFGRITGVTSNNPEVIISNIGNNTYKIQNAASVKEILDGIEKIQSTSSSFASGGARLGIKRITGNGSSGGFSGMLRSQKSNSLGQITYEKSMEFANLMNKGFIGSTKFYKNRNGYDVFSGYQSGRLALDRFKRMGNNISFRGFKRNYNDLAGKKLEGHYFAMKDYFENGGFKTSAPKEPTHAQLIRNLFAPDPSRKTSVVFRDSRKDFDIYRSIKNHREYKKNKVNKHARVETRNFAKSRIKRKKTGNIRVRKTQNKQFDKSYISQLLEKLKSRF